MNGEQKEGAALLTFSAGHQHAPGCMVPDAIADIERESRSSLVVPDAVDRNIRTLLAGSGRDSVHVHRVSGWLSAGPIGDTFQLVSLVSKPTGQV